MSAHLMCEAGFLEGLPAELKLALMYAGAGADETTHVCHVRLATLSIWACGDTLTAYGHLKELERRGYLTPIVPVDPAKGAYAEGDYKVHIPHSCEKAMEEEGLK